MFENKKEMRKIKKIAKQVAKLDKDMKYTILVNMLSNEKQILKELEILLEKMQTYIPVHSYFITSSMQRIKEVYARYEK